MRKTKRPTMKDVARLAGVSIQTVSTVVNDRATISDETRARILAAIDELGYKPLALARSLRTGSTRTIALVISDITNPFFAKLAETVEDLAHRAGYNLVLCNTHGDPDRERRYMQLATLNWVDGLLFVSTADTMHGLEPLRTFGIPVVAVDRIPSGYDGPWVILDNMATGRMVADHLLSLGHHHLAHISGPLDLRLSRERLHGFEEAVRGAGLTPVGHEAGDERWSCASGYSAMETLLRREQLPTAVFAANDRLAIGAMRAIADAGLSVPADISIVGVDDIEEAPYQSPPLTTVRQSLLDVATKGTQILLELLKGDTPDPSQIVFEPELIIRSSTAGPGPAFRERTREVAMA